MLTTGKYDRDQGLGQQHGGHCLSDGSTSVKCWEKPDGSGRETEWGLELGEPGVYLEVAPQPGWNQN